MELDIEQQLLQLRQWYSTPLGKQVAASTARYLRPVLAKMFGYYLLQLGLEPQHRWLADSPMSRRYLYQQQLVGGDVCGDYLQLPFANSSVDAVVLPHLLELHPQPECLLAEVQRILLPEGHLVIIGFNPFSSWRFYYWLSLQTLHVPWQASQLHSLWQVRCWLSTQDYQVLSWENFFFRPPFNHPVLLKKLAFLETLAEISIPFPGAIYVVIAQKKVLKQRLIKSVSASPNYVVGDQLAS